MNRLELLAIILICGLIASTATLLISYKQLYNAYLSRMPPISKREAVEIALEYGGYYKTGFDEMLVADVTLWHVKVSRTNDFDYEFLEEVNETLPNYNRFIEGNWTYYYVWEVTLSPGYRIPNSTDIAHYIPSDIYFVDASNGQMVTISMIFL